MKSFFSFQALEFKRFCRIWKLVVFFLVFIIFLFSVNRSSVSFKRELTKEKEFQENEAATFKKLMNYEHYSDKGINFLVVPGSTGIYFANPDVLSELSSRVNSIATLEINKNVQGKTVFKGNSLLTLKFSDLVSYMGCFLALFIGAEAMGRKEYLKLLFSRMPGWRLHLYTILSSFIVLTAGLILVSAVMLLVPLLHGVGLASIDTGHLWVYLGWALLMLLFFLLMGTIIGSIARSKVGFIPLLIIWFAFLVILPTLSGSIDEDISESLQSIHKLYHDKLQIVNEWEMRLAENNVKPNNVTLEESREIVNGYFKEEYPKIEALEKGLRNEVARIIESHRNRSIWTPVTFNNLLCSELSSRGYESYLRFLDFNIKKQREFLRFWIDMVYYVHHEDKKLENFFKKEGENIFTAKGILPANVGMGFAVNIIYVLILITASYFFFIQSLLWIDKEDKEKLGTVNVKMEKNWISSWLVKGDCFKEYLYHIFSGNSGKLARKGIKGSVVIDKKDTGGETQKHDFFYLCHHENLPEDVKVKHLILFFASLNKVPAAERKSIQNRTELKPLANRYIEDLKHHEIIEVLIAFSSLVKARVYLINDVATGLGGDYGDYVVKWKGYMDELKDAGALVIYLTTTDMSELHKHNRQVVGYFNDGEEWVYNVEAHKRSTEKNEEKQGNQ